MSVNMIEWIIIFVSLALLLIPLFFIVLGETKGNILSLNPWQIQIQTKTFPKQTYFSFMVCLTVCFGTWCGNLYCLLNILS